MDWRPVVGYEGLYVVSDSGIVESLERFVYNPRNGCMQFVPGKIMKHSRDSNGYHILTLSKGGPQKQFRVHVLVASAFLGVPNDTSLVVKHYDDNKDNNSLSNLSWGTESENHYDKVRNNNHHQTKKEKCPRGHPLVGGNLVPSQLKLNHRDCLACQRARGWLTRHDGDMQTISDRYFQRIVL